MSFTLLVTLILVLVVIGGVPLYGLPAILSLPPGRRQGIDALTINQAAENLVATSKTNDNLVEAARALVADRMVYSRRNSLDSAEKSFARGYGYCTQQSYALNQLLREMGFESKVVHAFQNRFPDGTVGSHAWVAVTLDQEVRYIDSMFYDAQKGEITFTPLSKVHEIGPVIKVFAWWGASAVNAHRYYVTGKDF